MNQELVGIKNLPAGQTYIGFCVVRKKEWRYKQTGEPYLVLELGDQSGRLKTKIWNNIDNYSKLIIVGGIVKIKAVIQVYQDRKELKTLKIRMAVEDDKVTLNDLLPKSDIDEKRLRERFYEHVNQIENSHFRKLISNILSDKKMEEAFFISPAGKLWHHNYLSGMADHVVAMLDMANILKLKYQFLNLDLLKTGIILHDIGKVEEYILNGFIDFSDKGRLLGYIAMGYSILENKIGELNKFPGELKKQLLHLVLSHQGKPEFGSSLVPMTTEAVVLQYLILLDAHTNALCRISKNDVLPGSTWTKYIKLLDRFIYVGDTKTE